MAIVTRGFPLALSRSTLLYAAAVVAVGALVLFGTSWAFGAAVAHAFYVTLMLLQSPARALRGNTRILAAGWAVVVSVTGFLIAPYGLWPMLIGLTAVALVQGFFRFGEIVSMTRAPANFVVFAGLSGTGMGVADVVLGSVLGALFILVLARFLFSGEKPPPPSSSAWDRLRYGSMLAVGSVIIVLIAHWLDFPFANWALLSFCLLLAVGADHRRRRAGERMLGTVIGVVIATVAALLPDPLPLIVVGLSAFLCVAYLRIGNYTLFVSFLTPAILLTMPTQLPLLETGIERVEAVVGAIVIALMVSVAAGVLSRQRSSSPVTETGD